MSVCIAVTLGCVKSPTHTSGLDVAITTCKRRQVWIAGSEVRGLLRGALQTWIYRCRATTTRCLDLFSNLLLGDYLPAICVVHPCIDHRRSQLNKGGVSDVLVYRKYHTQ